MSSAIGGKVLGVLDSVGLGEVAREAKLRIKNPDVARRRRHDLRFYSQFVRRGGLVFDVGANKGQRTELFLRLGARVVAVDPQPACVAALGEAFASSPDVMIVQTALGAAEGRAEMMVSDASVISSLSKEWVDSVKSSGRFAGHEWNGRVTVPVTTLDKLVERFGVPDFCKIDVEGYELEVLSGLSRAIRYVSFEFTPEFLKSGVGCVRRLEGIAAGTRFNYSLGESLELAMEEWVSADDMERVLERIDDPGHDIFGDVYARMDA